MAMATIMAMDIVILIATATIITAMDLLININTVTGIAAVVDQDMVQAIGDKIMKQGGGIMRAYCPLLLTYEIPPDLILRPPKTRLI